MVELAHEPGAITAVLSAELHGEPEVDSGEMVRPIADDEAPIANADELSRGGRITLGVRARRRCQQQRAEQHQRNRLYTQ